MLGSILLLAFADLAFLENNMLARNRIVLAQFKLLRVVLGVLLGHIEEASISGAYQLDVVLSFSHDFIT